MPRSSIPVSAETTGDSYRQLFTLLGDDEDQAARQYLLVRSKLITYFEGRRVSPAEDYADEVLHRTAAKIGAGEEIEDVGRYVFGIARFVRLESYRKPDTETIGDDHLGSDERPAKMPAVLTVEAQPYDGEGGSESVMQECLRECLVKLDENKRQLILTYYEADEASGKHIEHRRQLAERNKQTAGALQKQICLLRKKISDCAKACVQRELG
jgi:DNA-directed RNA polymerase specialized sigma24 family protein